MGRDWIYCPVCKKMVGDQGAECEHYDKYDDWVYGNDWVYSDDDWVYDDLEERRRKINFWEFCEKVYGVKSDFTNEEYLILSNNTGRMFGAECCCGIFGVPEFNCSFRVDLDGVLQEYRKNKNKKI